MMVQTSNRLFLSVGLDSELLNYQKNKNKKVSLGPLYLMLTETTLNYSMSMSAQVTYDYLIKRILK